MTTLSTRRGILIALSLCLLIVALSAISASAAGPCTTVCYADAVGGNDANDGDTPATAKLTIQAAINAVTAGGEVRVLPGTYMESPHVTKSLTLVSTGGKAVTTIMLQKQPVAPTYLGSLQIDGAIVTVDGFTIVGFDADCVDYGTDGNQPAASTNLYVTLLPTDVVIKNNTFKVGDNVSCLALDEGIGVATYYTAPTLPINSLLVENNVFEPVLAGARRAFYINPGTKDFTFRGNTINGQFKGTSITQATNGLVEWNAVNGTGTSRGMGTWGFPDPTTYGATVFQYNTFDDAVNALSLYGTENVMVWKNTFTNNDKAVYIPTDAAFDMTTIHINRNSIDTNVKGVENDYTDDVDATCNWWGAADGPGAVGPGTGDPVDSDVLFAPWLFSSDLDGLCANSVFMSATLPGVTDDALVYGMEDIIAYDGTGWSTWFDGSAAGLFPTGKWKHNINAIYIPDPTLPDVVMSFTQNARFVNGLVPKVDGMDLVWWDGTNWSLFFDGSDVDLTNKTQEKIDALHILPGAASPIGAGCIHYLLISTQGPGRVTNGNLPGFKFGGEDVLGFCMTNSGANTTGLWHILIDGSAEGMPRNATDSISMSADGNTLYLTTKKAFAVDAAFGNHSMVYTYDMTTTDFAGPVFVAADYGLHGIVDALEIK